MLDEQPGGPPDEPPAPRPRPRPALPRVAVPRRVTTSIWLHGPLDLTRVLLNLPARVLAAGENLLRSVEQIQPVLERLDRVVGDAGSVVSRLSAAMAELRPLLVAVAELDPDLADDAAEVVAQLLPLLQQLHEAVPEVHGIRSVVARLEPVLVDVETRIAGLPGSGRLRERGEREIDRAQR